MRRVHFTAPGLFLLAAASSCTGRSIVPPGDSGPVDAPTDHHLTDVATDDGTAPTDVTIDTPHDAGIDVRDVAIDTGVDVPPREDVPVDAPTGPTFCSLPGGGTVAGAVVPSGFCIRRWAERNEARAPRTIAFAPNGDLFIGSPSLAGAGCFPSTEGCGMGMASILVLRDADHDGTAEVHTFASGLADVHGIAIGPDAVFFTTNAGVWRTDYADGQLAEVPATRMQLASFTGSFRWTHGLARSRAGRLYATAGVYGSSCPDPNVGAIFEVTGGALRMVAHGFRNPMYARCHATDEVCAIDELGDDGGAPMAREKFVLLRESTDYGYPCCFTQGNPAGTASCNSVALEDAPMPLNDTPFGLDWERGMWGGAFTNAVFVAKHGSFYHLPRWRSAGIWWAPADPTTHVPTGEFTQLVSGFGEMSPELRRASDVAFASDGRLFFADDYGGIYWVAPDTLRSR